MVRTCQRIHTCRDTQEQRECGAPAKWEAYGATLLLCDDCLHDLFQDEPVESFNANVNQLQEL